MDRWRFRVAVWTGRILSRLLRGLGRKATTLPGVVALRLDPRFFSSVGRRFRGRVVLITGTNGKTTTNNLLSEWLGRDGWSVISNRLGANLAQGLASAVVEQLSFRLRPKEAAVFEVDEATVAKVVEELKPKVVVVTNFFRDQMDRYGELDRVVELVAEGLKKLPEDGICVVNGDDPLAHSAVPENCAVRFFGVDDPSRLQPSCREVRDGKFCRFCGHALAYEGFFYGQIGVWWCPGCNRSRPRPSIAARRLTEAGEGLDFEVEGWKARLDSPGLYNVYNVLAAYGAAEALGVSREVLGPALRRIRTGLGRVERFTVGGRPLTLALVKNPAGFNEQLKVLRSTPGVSDVVLVLNDLYADGTDVSWIWDVEMEQLAGVPFERIWCAGTRAEDMAVRVRYAEWSGELRVIREPRDAVAFAAAEKGGATAGRIFVLTTYTSLYPLRDWILERGGVEDRGDGGDDRPFISRSTGSV